MVARRDRSSQPRQTNERQGKKPPRSQSGKCKYVTISKPELLQSPMQVPTLAAELAYYHDLTVSLPTDCCSCRH